MGDQDSTKIKLPLAKCNLQLTWGKLIELNSMECKVHSWYVILKFTLLYGYQGKHLKLFCNIGGVDDFRLSLNIWGIGDLKLPHNIGKADDLNPPVKDTE